MAIDGGEIRFRVVADGSGLLARLTKDLQRAGKTASKSFADANRSIRQTSRSELDGLRKVNSLLKEQEALNRRLGKSANRTAGTAAGPGALLDIEKQTQAVKDLSKALEEARKARQKVVSQGGKNSEALETAGKAEAKALGDLARANETLTKSYNDRANAIEKIRVAEQKALNQRGAFGAEEKRRAASSQASQRALADRANAARSRGGSISGAPIVSDSDVRNSKQVANNMERASQSARRLGQATSASRSGFGGGLAGYAKGIGNLALSIAGVVALFSAFSAGIGLIGSSVSKFREFNEALNKTRVLFGDVEQGFDNLVSGQVAASGIVEQFAKSNADDLGIGPLQALEQAGILGAQIDEISSTNKESAQTTIAALRRIADNASFFDTSFEDAAQALASGLVGQPRPLRRFGVDVSRTALKAETSARVGAIQQTGQISEEEVTKVKDLQIAYAKAAKQGGTLARQRRKALDAGVRAYVKQNQQQLPLQARLLKKLEIQEQKTADIISKKGENSVAAEEAKLRLAEAQDRLLNKTLRLNKVLNREEVKRAALNKFFQDTSVAAGDFRRTRNAIANLERRVFGNFELLQLRAGRAIAPLYRDLLAFTNDAIKDANTEGFQRGLESLADTIREVAKLFGELGSAAAPVFKELAALVGPTAKALTAVVQSLKSIGNIPVVGSGIGELAVFAAQAFIATKAIRGLVKAGAKVGGKSGIGRLLGLGGAAAAGGDDASGGKKKGKSGGLPLLEALFGAQILSDIRTRRSQKALTKAQTRLAANASKQQNRLFSKFFNQKGAKAAGSPFGSAGAFQAGKTANISKLGTDAVKAAGKLRTLGSAALFSAPLLLSLGPAGLASVAGITALAGAAIAAKIAFDKLNQTDTSTTFEKVAQGRERITELNESLFDPQALPFTRDFGIGEALTASIGADEAASQRRSELVEINQAIKEFKQQGSKDLKELRQLQRQKTAAEQDIILADRQSIAADVTLRDFVRSASTSTGEDVEALFESFRTYNDAVTQERNAVTDSAINTLEAFEDISAEDARLLDAIQKGKGGVDNSIGARATRGIFDVFTGNASQLGRRGPDQDLINIAKQNRESGDFASFQDNSAATQYYKSLVSSNKVESEKAFSDLTLQNLSFKNKLSSLYNQRELVKQLAAEGKIGEGEAQILYKSISDGIKRLQPLSVKISDLIALETGTFGDLSPKIKRAVNRIQQQTQRTIKTVQKSSTLDRTDKSRFSNAAIDSGKAKIEKIKRQISEEVSVKVTDTDVSGAAAAGEVLIGSANAKVQEANVDGARPVGTVTGIQGIVSTATAAPGLGSGIVVNIRGNIVPDKGKVGAFVGKNGFNAGGVVPGGGSSRVDSVLAALAPGEVVLNRQQQSLLGTNNIAAVLNRTNAKNASKYPANATGATIGGDIDSGMSIGLAAGRSVSAAAGLAGAVISTAKNVLGIRSPSVVFIEIGGDVAEGLSIGLRRNQKFIEDAMKSMSMVLGDSFLDGLNIQGRRIASHSNAIIKKALKEGLFPAIRSAQTNLISAGDSIGNIIGETIDAALNESIRKFEIEDRRIQDEIDRLQSVIDATQRKSDELQFRQDSSSINRRFEREDLTAGINDRQAAFDQKERDRRLQSFQSAIDRLRTARDGATGDRRNRLSEAVSRAEERFGLQKDQDTLARLQREESLEQRKFSVERRGIELQELKNRQLSFQIDDFSKLQQANGRASDALQREADLRNEVIRRELSDLSTLRATGRINNSQYQQALGGILRENGISFSSIGELLGLAKSLEFDASLATARGQSTAINGLPLGINPFFDPNGITKPRQDFVESLKSIVTEVKSLKDSNEKKTKKEEALVKSLDSATKFIDTLGEAPNIRIDNLNLQTKDDKAFIRRLLREESRRLRSGRI